MPSDNNVTLLSGALLPQGIIDTRFSPTNKQKSTTDMEAEQLNSIANRLADIAQRSGELRRYL